MAYDSVTQFLMSLQNTEACDRLVKISLHLALLACKGETALENGYLNHFLEPNSENFCLVIHGISNKKYFL